MKSNLKSLVLAALLASVGVASWAQNGPSTDKPMAHAQGKMMHGDKMDSGRMESMMAKRTTELKAKLKLSAAQEGAWTTFTSAMKPSGNMMAQRPDRAEFDKLSTPERIDKMKAIRTQQHAEMAAEMEKRDEAIKTFYATLTPEQKKVFDTEHARMGARGEHGSEHGRR
ncbi:Spy/CpxP family protein refolding chaperone [Rhodoferax aquaticus]|uniref:Spy/CpxP family protein refolding chaperone n=1 Tax=Rhodoferax aquaticus TaxID=2527691 RepID=A0A515EJ66_9BURK|nr:Spy/CpxP family protein refolding chaperone [Rhodoferax aquaticus]QDL52700.1 hypothetical protein EXZ61_00090 [Rhodoferax aquaticus]